MKQSRRGANIGTPAEGVAFTIHTHIPKMKTGSISSKEKDDDGMQEDCKLPALPLEMKIDDPVRDTWIAWARKPHTFLHRHSPEDFDEIGTTTPTNTNSSNNHIRQYPYKMPDGDIHSPNTDITTNPFLFKMPHDDIPTTCYAEEECLDGERPPMATRPLSFGSQYLSEIMEHTVPFGAAAEKNTSTYEDRSIAGYGLDHYSQQSVLAVKAAHVNHTKTPVAPPEMESMPPSSFIRVSSTICSPTAFMSAEIIDLAAVKSDDESDDTMPYGDIHSPNTDITKIPSLLKMPYDDIPTTRYAEEECLDEERPPMVTSVFPPTVCLPDLDDHQHKHTATTSICALNVNQINHPFKQTTKNYSAGDVAFDQNTMPGTYTTASITMKTSLSLSATAGRYHSNITSGEAQANCDSSRPMIRNHPSIITFSPPLAPKSMGDKLPPLPLGFQYLSEIMEHTAPSGAAAEKNTLTYEDRLIAGYGLEHYSHQSSVLAVKAAHANHTKTPVAPPEMESMPPSSFVRVSSTICSPTAATVIKSEEDNDDQAKKQKNDRHFVDPWLVKFELLKKYKDEHGSCDVRQKDRLGSWVNKQRMEYKAFVEGKRRSSMTGERRRLLESIDFKWAELKGQASWEKRFKELVAFKSEHGHCDYPTKSKDNAALGRWVTTQRSAKKNGDINEDNERRLNDIGFMWKVHPKKQPNEDKECSV